MTNITTTYPGYHSSVYCIHHRHLKADTHFIIPQRIEGRVHLGGWLHVEMVYLPTDIDQRVTTTTNCQLNYVII